MKILMMFISFFVDMHLCALVCIYLYINVREGIGKVTGDELNWKGWEAVFVGNHSVWWYEVQDAQY